MPKDDGLRRCPICGCTDLNPCDDDQSRDGACGWDEIGVCTACAEDPVELAANLAGLDVWCRSAFIDVGKRLSAVIGDIGISTWEIQYWLKMHGKRVREVSIRRVLAGLPDGPSYVADVAEAIQAIRSERCSREGHNDQAEVRK